VSASCSTKVAADPVDFIQPRYGGVFYDSSSSLRMGPYSSSQYRFHRRQ
jgi:hypothetical protein